MPIIHFKRRNKMESEPKKPTCKSSLDEAIYKQIRELLPHGYLEAVAKRHQLPGWKARRVLMGYYSENDGTHKNLREEVLKKVAEIGKKKATELQRITVSQN